MKTITDEYRYCDIILSETTECGVDMEYYLPDYCPDIQKILSCCSNPQIENISISGERITVNGNLNVTVMYCDNKASAIRSCEFSKEFTANMKLPVSGFGATVQIRPHTGHTVCRAVNARKLDVHIPVFLDTDVVSLFSDDYTCDMEGAEKLTKTAEASEAIMNICREFSFSQDFELAESAPPIESVFRKDIRIAKLSYTPEADCITVKGEIEFTVCYKSYEENSVLEKIKYNIPFSEAVPYDGVISDPELMWNICACPVNHSVQLKEDSMGEYTKLSLYLKGNIYIKAYKNTLRTVVADAYATGCISREKYGKICLREYEHYSVKNELIKSLPLENCEKILDLWCSDLTVSAFTEPGKITYRGSFDIHVLYTDRDKRLSSLLKSLDFTYVTEISDPQQRKSVVSGDVTVGDFRLLSENELEIKFEICLDAFVVLRKYEDMVTESEMVTELPKDMSGRLVICYDRNKSIWELGKKHRIPTETIKEINSICDDGDCSYPLIIFR